MITDDDVDEIVYRAAGDGDHRGAAARLEALAERTGEHDDPTNRASLLVDAGSQYGIAQDWPEAIRCYRAAVADGSPCSPDARAWLHDALLRAGQTDEASTLRATLKATRSDDPALYEAVAESLEQADLRTDAHTWFTMGYHRCEAAPVPEFMLDLLLVGRRRVRHSLGHPADDLDAVAEAYLNSVAVD
ncbi:tetratricopeptide repeat protein [Frankia sp. AiPa1]|uniref:tetratricopeptide repeat protein n=1 Tax=Frankia sp. AiPa1 TaxID=573492 RepID=UPI00202B9640|nr:tetratricopeptide repeat protein [Frankia sp. AiPa1]MCL9762015.1 tetratricopeptide repeat protein [Frankia sp. AiPa1]